MANMFIEWYWRRVAKEHGILSVPSCEEFTKLNYGGEWDERCPICVTKDVDVGTPIYCENPLQPSKSSDYLWAKCKRGHKFKLRQTEDWGTSTTANEMTVYFGTTTAT